CGHCGMVEQTWISSGSHYDACMPMQAVVGELRGHCASRVGEPGNVRRRLYEW
ncbi:hypothetical protein A2U01_0092597, partial [Trifolium medium]|nr:hypothetical protein [Trifolium medium]